MSGPAQFTRTDTARVEPRYLALLEAERAAWWTPENFAAWRALYVSEYARGFAVQRLLARHVPEFQVAGARVLDVGCGDAGLAIAFAEHGARAAGIEPSAASVARGAARAAEHGVALDLRQGTGEALPWADASFDLVVLDNVLEHVDDRERALGEAHRVLAPAGLLYLVTPKPFALASLVSDPHYQLAGLVLLPRAVQRWYFERMRGGGRGAYAVGVIPTRRSARRLLRRAGFRELTDARQLWLDYLRERIAEPAEVRAGKRGLARWLAAQPRAFTNPVARWLLDVAMGSNFFVARREP